MLNLTQSFYFPILYHNRRRGLQTFARLFCVGMAALAVMGLMIPGVVQAGEPQQAVRSLLETIQQIKEVEGLPPEEAKANRALMDRAVVHLDVPRVSEKTLGRHWEKRSAEERKQFIELLGELFRYVAFPNSAKFFRELEIEYKGNSVEGGTATVPVIVRHPDEGRISIDFVMFERGGKWRVEDVIMDGVSMRTNLRSQFHQVIRKEEFSGLVQRMQGRLEQARRGD